MARDDRIQNMTFATRWLAAERGAAEPLITELLSLPPSAWRDALGSRSDYRRYGVLDGLLREARSRLHTEPTVARELAAAVRPFAETVTVPIPLFALSLRGNAWKEYANALLATGDLHAALSAARAALSIYDQSPALVIDGAKARLVEAQILRQRGEHDRALRIARESAATFRAFRDSEALVAARITEACVLFAAKQFREALSIFSALAKDAAERRDKPTLARTLHNAAECARELGDIAASRDFHRRALVHFTELGLTTEIARVRWGYALATEAEGRRHEAMSELYATRAEYLMLGKVLTAASVGLDIVRIAFTAGDDVAALASEIIRTFSDAGITPNALEALAYLREQASRGLLTLPKITSVRRYLEEVGRAPALLFAEPPEDRDG